MVDAEKDALAASRLAGHAPKAGDETFNFAEFKQLFYGKDLTMLLGTYGLPIVCFTLAASSYSLSFYLPTIILTLGDFHSWQAQLLTVPLYIIAVIAAVGFSYASDKVTHAHRDPASWRGSRAPHLMACFVISIIGLGLWTAGISGWAGYFAGGLILAGTQAAVPIFFAWTTSRFFSGSTGHSVGIAWVNGVGSLGGFAAPYFFAGGLEKGFAVNLGLAVFGLVLVSVLDVEDLGCEKAC